MGHSEATRLQHVMTTLVYLILQRSHRETATRMTEKRFRHLPLVRDDQVVGLIAIGEVGESIMPGKIPPWLDWKTSPSTRCIHTHSFPFHNRGATKRIVTMGVPKNPWRGCYNLKVDLTQAYHAVKGFLCQ